MREPRARYPCGKKRPEMFRLSPFVLNGLVLSLLSLKYSFCPVLCPVFPTSYEAQHEPSTKGAEIRKTGLPLKPRTFFFLFTRERTEKSTLEVYVQWMRAMKKDYTLQKVIETQKDLKDTDAIGPNRQN